MGKMVMKNDRYQFLKTISHTLLLLLEFYDKIIQYTLKRIFNISSETKYKIIILFDTVESF